MIAGRLARDRVIALAGSPGSGRRLSADLLGMVHGLDLWIWGDLDQATLEDWRRIDFEPMSAPHALEDLLIYAALAQDWNAVATCALAIEATRRRAQDLRMVLWDADQLNPPLAPREARALTACVSAWNTRGSRLRRQMSEERERGSHGA